jgi:hypothetical protein
MDDMNIQPYPTPKIQKNCMLNPSSMSKIKKILVLNIHFGLDFFSLIKSNNPKKSQPKSKNPLFLDFWH